jgi:hypothetical protein
MEDIGLAKMMHNIDKTKKRPLRNHEKIKRLMKVEFLKNFFLNPKPLIQ